MSADNLTNTAGYIETMKQKDKTDQSGALLKALAVCWGNKQVIILPGFKVTMGPAQFVTAEKDGRTFLVCQKNGQRGFSLWPEEVSKTTIGTKRVWRSDKAIYIPQE